MSSSLNRKERVRTLGALGENIVADYFSSKGCQVSQSEDWFDDEKDMTIDGKTVEVKTLMPIYKFNSFCLPIEQGRKCEGVDRLIFVKIPAQRDDPIRLYESHIDTDANRRYDFREHFNGQLCLFYRLTFLENFDTIQDMNKSSLLWDLSPSEYKGCFNETRINRGS
jgi:hypothetical protein